MTLKSDLKKASLTKEQLVALKKILTKKADDAGFGHLWGYCDICKEITDAISEILEEK